MTDESYATFKNHPVFGCGTLEWVKMERPVTTMMGFEYDRSWAYTRCDGVHIGWHKDDDGHWKLLNAGERIERWVDEYGDEQQDLIWFDPSHPGRKVLFPPMREKTFHVAGHAHVEGRIACFMIDPPFEGGGKHDLIVTAKDGCRMKIRGLIVVGVHPQEDCVVLHFMADDLLQLESKGEPTEVEDTPDFEPTLAAHCSKYECTIIDAFYNLAEALGFVVEEGPGEVRIRGGADVWAYQSFDSIDAQETWKQLWAIWAKREGLQQ